MFAKRIGNVNRKRPRNDCCLLYSSQHCCIENGGPDPDIDDSDDDDVSDDDFVDGGPSANADAVRDVLRSESLKFVNKKCFIEFC